MSQEHLEGHLRQGEEQYKAFVADVGQTHRHLGTLLAVGNGAALSLIGQADLSGATSVPGYAVGAYLLFGAGIAAAFSSLWISNDTKSKAAIRVLLFANGLRAELHRQALSAKAGQAIPEFEAQTQEFLAFVKEARDDDALKGANKASSALFLASAALFICGLIWPMVCR